MWYIIGAVVAALLLVGLANQQKYNYACTSPNGGCVCVALDSLDCE